MSAQQIKPLLKSYAKHAYEAVIECQDKFDGNSTPLIPFIIPIAYKTAAYAFFGGSFPAEKSYKPYKDFESVFHLRMAGVPDFFLKKGIQGWEEVTQMIEDYLKTPHDDSFELVQMLEREAKAEGFVRQSATDGCTELIPLQTDQNIAQSLSSDLWALQSNTPWAAYWTIVLQLQRPEGLTPLINEVHSARASWVANHPDCKFEENISKFAAGDSLPLLVSTIRETLRFSTFSLSIRVVQEHLNLGGYQFNKGEEIACVTRSIHLDEEIHENAQSFVPDRYLKHKIFKKDGRSVPNHTMPFGGGLSQCQGRYVDPLYVRRAGVSDSCLNQTLCNGRVEDSLAAPAAVYDYRDRSQV
jgi:cytochrome P450